MRTRNGNCNGCNERTDYSYSSAYGGDHYYSCSICGWHSEGDEQPTIKQGLTLKELVEHKKQLNELYAGLHEMGQWDMMNILMDIMRELVTYEEE